MSVIRQQNWLGQQRVDLPHLRSVESSIAADFDVLAGRALAGEQALVLRGFELTGVSVGGPATSLQMSTANGVAFNRQATESGTFLWVPADRAVETLNPTSNSRVVGGWVTGTNYVGLDYVRDADSSTTDIVQFKSANSSVEIPRQVALGKTLDYRIQISAVPFSAEPHIVPIAKVGVDSLGLITGIEDARPMMFRLGSGGDLPQPLAPFAKWTREEYLAATDNTAFQGGDKTITSMKDWMDASMTRMWEIGGGEFWYSATADRNVTLITYGPTFNNGEYFLWTLGSSTLQWKGLRLLFDNSTAYNADIADGTVVGLAPGECLYVDADRTRFYAPARATTTAYILGDIVVNVGLAFEAIVAGTSGGGGGPVSTDSSDPSMVDGTVTWKYIGPGTAGGLTPAKAALATLSTGTPPGSRWILAWRRADQIFVRGWRYPVGTLFTPATTTAQGVLKLSRDYTGTDVVGTSGLNNPIALSDRGGIITVPAGKIGLNITGSTDYGLLVDNNHATKATLIVQNNGAGRAMEVAATSTAPAVSISQSGAGKGLEVGTNAVAGTFGSFLENADTGGALDVWTSSATDATVRIQNADAGKALVLDSKSTALANPVLDVLNSSTGPAGKFASTSASGKPTLTIANAGAGQVLSIAGNATSGVAALEILNTGTGGGAIIQSASDATTTLYVQNSGGPGGQAAITAVSDSDTVSAVAILSTGGSAALSATNSGTGATVLYENASSSGASFPTGKTMKKVLGGGDFKIQKAVNCTPQWWATGGGGGEGEVGAIGTGLYSGNNGSASFYTAFTLPLNAVVTSVYLRVKHAGSAAAATGAGINGYLYLWKMTKGVGGWTKASMLNAGDFETLGLAAAPASETFGPITVHATVANRTIQSIDESVVVSIATDTDVGQGVNGYFNAVWLEINYTMYDTLSW